jgi:hypothetical protein
MIPIPFFSKPSVLLLKNVSKIVPHLEYGKIMVVIGLGTLCEVSEWHFKFFKWLELKYV